MSMSYCTLWELRDELGLGADETKDDRLLRRLLDRGSDWINGQQLRRHFDPRRETRHFDTLANLDGFSFNAWMSTSYARGILFDDDLSELITLTDGAGGVLTSDMYFLHPANTLPKYGASLRFSANTLWQPDEAGDYERAAEVDGVWCWHDRYDDAWADTLDTVGDDPLADDSTTITVAAIDGPTEDSDDPRFQVGNLIRLGSGDTFEYCLVRAATDAVAPAPPFITVKRGAQGTTAQAWPLDTPIFVFRPAVRGALIRLATWGYRLKDVSFYERVTLLGSTQKVAPGGIPDDVYELLPPPPVVIR